MCGVFLFFAILAEGGLDPVDFFAGKGHVQLFPRDPCLSFLSFEEVYAVAHPLDLFLGFFKLRQLFFSEFYQLILPAKLVVHGRDQHRKSHGGDGPEDNPAQSHGYILSGA
jgi:hypothetical protein